MRPLPQRPPPPHSPGAPLGAGRGEAEGAEERRSAGRGRGCLGGAPREGPGVRPASGLFVSASRGSPGSSGQGEAAEAGSRVWTGREEKRDGEE